MSEAPDEAEALIGHVVAERYRVDALLGVGGMGAVFRAHHLGLKRDVALKVLHPELGSDEQLLARFDREAQSASRLEHPNCIQVTDFGVWRPAEGALPVKFMVMALLKGQELTDLLGAPLPAPRAVRLAIQVLRGLQHAHDQGIVHRDLKPENVFVTTDHEGSETLKLVDFGIAKIVAGEGAGDKMTRAGLVFGTPTYMSPEQAAGAEIDARSDIYSCGIMLYEMLAGVPPFNDDHPVELVRAHMTREPPPLPDTVDGKLAEVVMAMLAKNAKNRIGTADEARERLEALLPDLDTTTEARASAPTAPGVDGTAATVLPVAANSLSAAASKLAPVLDDARGKLAPILEDRKKLAMAGTGAVLALFAVIGLASRGDGDDPGPAVVGKEATAPPAEPGLLGALLVETAPDEDIAKLDRELLGGDLAGARQHIRPLLDEYPKDPALLWRHGRLLRREAGRGKKQDEVKLAAALTAYADALTGKSSLLDDREFYSELSELLREPPVQDQAINLALQRMGSHAHKFLLELVNRETNALGYVDRHRILDVLLDDGEAQPLVHLEFNRALDLWQAGQSTKPCQAFADALEVIADEPSAYYLSNLARVVPPTESPDPEDQKGCMHLPARQLEVRAALTKEFPKGQSPTTIPPDYRKKKKRRRGLRGLFGG